MHSNESLQRPEALELDEIHEDNHSNPQRFFTDNSLNHDGFLDDYVDPVSPVADHSSDEFRQHHQAPEDGPSPAKASPEHVELSRPNVLANEQAYPLPPDIVPRPINRLTSARMLNRLALNIGIALLSLYFVVFAILAKVHHKRPIEDKSDGEALLAAAQFGPTIFAIVFAAIVGRFLKSVAATFLEHGTTVGLIECLLGGRTVAGATALPFSVQFLHPVMIILLLIWSMSPLGGQAALRVVSSRLSEETFPSTFHYLDIMSSPNIVAGASARQAYGNVILAAFNAALSSSASAKSANQDLYGNLKIPMIEPLAADRSPNQDGWFDILSEDSVVYSSLAGLPFLGAASGHEATFSAQSSYLHATCSLSVQQQDTRVLLPIFHSNTTYPTDPRGSIITNEMHLAFIMDREHAGLASRPLNVTMLSEAFQTSTRTWHLTTADCLVTTSYVETQVSCDGDMCRVSAIRRSTMPHDSPNVTAIDGIFMREPASVPNNLTQETFFSVLINATTQDFRNIHVARASPFEYYFVNPDSPFNAVIDQDAPVLYDVGASQFSHLLTQLFNTLWLDSVAPYALTGNFTAPSNADYGVTTVEGTLSRSQEVLHCDDGWLAILFLTSFVVLAAGIGTAALDAVRRGPEVLDSFVFALRDNRYVRVSLGSSMDDSADMAKRLRKAEVRFGDVRPDEDVGHVAIGTCTDIEIIEPLSKSRLYA